jgi:hypothetical protein
MAARPGRARTAADVMQGRAQDGEQALAEYSPVVPLILLTALQKSTRSLSSPFGGIPTWQVIQRRVEPRGGIVVDLDDAIGRRNRIGRSCEGRRGLAVKASSIRFAAFSEQWADSQASRSDHSSGM